MSGREKFLIFILASVFAGAAGSPVPAQETVVRIATGKQGGVYFPAGRGICRLVDLERRKTKIKCVSDSTDGSVFNLKAIRDGRFQLALVQSDWLHYSLEGTSVFAAQGANPELRSVFSLHSEAFTVVARSDSGVRRFGDLKGKRIDAGLPGSGIRGTTSELFRFLGWKGSDFSAVTKIDPAKRADALCDGRIDAFIHVVGHPSGAIKEVSKNCRVKIVNAAGGPLDKFVQARKYYRRLNIPAGLYRGTVNDVRTFGVSATLVATEVLGERTVYDLVRSVFDNFSKFKSFHPAFKNLNRSEMATEGLAAPLHPGAEKYFREAGLL